MITAVLFALLLPQASPVDAANKKVAAGDFEAAVPLYTQALAGGSGAPALRGRADAWYRLGEFDKACDDYTAAHKISSDADLVARRGLARLRSKGAEVASPDFEEAVALDPKCALAAAGQAGVYLMEGNLDMAERSVEKAMKLSPELPEALYVRSLLRSVQGNPLSARHDADRAIAKDPFHIEARRARVGLLLAEKDADAAMKDIDELVRLRPKSDEFVALRAAVHSEGKRFDAALADLTRAIELNPKSVAYLFQRATLYRRQLKDPAKAVADYSAALALQPANTDVLTGRGYAYVRLKDWRASARDLARACELNEEDPWGPYNLACFHGLHAAELKDEARRRAVDFAFRWIQEARDSGYLKLKCGCHPNGGTLEHLRTDSDLDVLHDDKRWKAASAADEDD